MNPDLNRDLPLNLRDRLAGVLVTGEVPRISLPGSYGEGLVVTDRRAIILRESLSGFNADSNIEEMTYLLSDVSEVEVTTTDTGGLLLLKGLKMPQEIEKHAVFFPSYDLDKFTAAKDAINAMITALKAPSSQTAAGVPSADGGAPSAEDQDGKCSRCGAELKPNSLFCTECGASVGFACEVCFGRIPNGSKFCPGCGNPAVPDEGKCQGCGRTTMFNSGYCVWCGHAVGSKCYVCGSPVSKVWVHCANCGRKMGSEVLDPRALRAAYSRAADETQTSSPIFGESTPKAQPQTPAQPDQAASAAQHNQRGKELFEQDQLKEAINEFEIAVQMEPDNSAYRCNLAVAYDEDDRDDEALEEYQRTLELDPNDTTALLYMGYMYSENDDAEEAARLWQRVIDVAPGSPDAEEARENLRHLGEL